MFAKRTQSEFKMTASWKIYNTSEKQELSEDSTLDYSKNFKQWHWHNNYDLIEVRAEYDKYQKYV